MLLQKLTVDIKCLKSYSFFILNKEQYVLCLDFKLAVLTGQSQVNFRSQCFDW